MAPVFSTGAVVHPHRKTERASRQMIISLSILRTCSLDTTLHDLFRNILSASSLDQEMVPEVYFLQCHEIKPFTEVREKVVICLDWQEMSRMSRNLLVKIR
jgi:hypothetical protein